MPRSGNNSYDSLPSSQSPILMPRVSMAADGIADMIIEENEDIHSHGHASGTIFSSTINLLNTILGTGMLAMPNAIASIGMIPGLLCIIISGFASRLGLLLLAKSATYAPPRQASFNSISRLTYPQAALLFDLAVAVKCFGVAVSYLIIIADLLPEVCRQLLPDNEALGFLVNRNFWLLCSMALIIPLSLLRHLDSLKYTSLLALTSVVYLLVLVIYAYADHQSPVLPPGDTPLFRSTWLFWKKLSVFVFAFTCHQNLFSIHNELVDNSFSRVRLIVSGSVGLSCCIYLIIGALGYLMFGINSDSNILKMLALRQPVLLIVARISFALLVIFSYPLQCHPSRASFDKLIVAAVRRLNSKTTGSGGNGVGSSTITGLRISQYSSLVDTTDAAESAANEQSDDEGKESRPIIIVGEECDRTADNGDKSNEPIVESTGDDKYRHFLITTAILMCSYTIAFLVSDLSLVLSFVGATGSVTICYILPSLFYLRLTAGEGYSVTTNHSNSWDPYRLGAMILLPAGCILMPACLIFVFL